MSGKLNLNNIKDSLLSFYSSNKDLINRSLLGAAIGGSATGAVSLLTSKDKKIKNALKYGLIGGLLGGGLGATYPKAREGLDYIKDIFKDNQLRKKSVDIKGSIDNSLKSIDPELKKAVIRGLIGALIGGTASGYIAKKTKRDEDDKKSVIGPALLGAVLAGGFAAGLPYGISLLSVPSKKEPKQPFLSRAFDSATRRFLNNLGISVGGAVGARFAAPSIGLIHHGLRNPHELFSIKELYSAPALKSIFSGSNLFEVTDPNISLNSIKFVKGDDGKILKVLKRFVTPYGSGVSKAVLTKPVGKLDLLRRALFGSELWRPQRTLDYTIVTDALRQNAAKSGKALKLMTGLRGTRAALAAIPAGMLLGYIAQKAIKGDY